MNQADVSQDDLFHPFTRSPCPVIEERGEMVKKAASCSICLAETAAGKDLPAEHETVRVAFECPGCGWPVHCSEEQWAEDEGRQSSVTAASDCVLPSSFLTTTRSLCRQCYFGGLHEDLA